MYQLDSLFKFDFARLENKRVLKLLNQTSRSLAYLKGRAVAIPNPVILFNTLVLQESKTSNEVEGIVTTNDMLFQGMETIENIDFATKEVLKYREALLVGIQDLKEKEGLLTNNTIIKIQNKLKDTNSEFRQQVGTKLTDNQGNIIYTPPQDPAEVIRLMNDLEKFINDSDNIDCDPLIKMALIHHQFESIHPFTDGNGRTGRILNSLYLQKEQLLTFPILYLSRYFVRNKSLYYHYLQKVRDEEAWEDWVIYFLTGILTISERASVIVLSIKELMDKYKRIIRDERNYKFYSQDLINVLFEHPYVTQETMMRKLNKGQATISKYLTQLCNDELLLKIRKGKMFFYVNCDLFKIFEQMDPIEKK